MSGLEEVAHQIPAVLGGGVGVAVLNRLFGGSVDEVGDALTRLTHRRARNVGLIAENADQKSSGKPEHAAVSERVALAVLNEGSYSGDSWVVEYIGGVLASSRSEVSRDDRGVTWTSLISRLSTYDLRSHYLWYRALRELALQARLDVNLNDANDTQSQMVFVMPISSYYSGMDFQDNDEFNLALTHCLYGLKQEDLIDWKFVGKGDTFRAYAPGAPDDAAGLVLMPTVRGVQLYLWAAGLGDRPVQEYLDPSVDVFSNVDLDYPRDSFLSATPMDHPWSLAPEVDQ